jgi:hypothetical protein
MKGDGDECCRRDGGDGRDVEAEIAEVRGPKGKHNRGRALYATAPGRDR